jgi:hypothetical protein
MQLIHALLLMIAYRTQRTQALEGERDSLAWAYVRLDKLLKATYRVHVV